MTGRATILNENANLWRPLNLGYASSRELIPLSSDHKFEKNINIKNIEIGKEYLITARRGYKGGGPGAGAPPPGALREWPRGGGGLLAKKKKLFG